MRGEEAFDGVGEGGIEVHDGVGDEAGIVRNRCSWEGAAR